MKKCNLYLKIGGESILIASGVDSSLMPSEINQDFLNLVKNSGQIELLRNRLEEVLLEGVTDRQIEGIERDELEDYQIANTTAKDIALTCPNVSFPQIDLSKVKVRIVDKFKNYGNNIIIKTSPNGEPIYVLDGNPATIRKFARHLSIEDAVNNQVLDKLDKDSRELKVIDKVLEKAKVKYKKLVTDRQSLLKHYIKNKTKYNKITIAEGSDVYTASVLLDEIIPLIENIYYPKNNNYSTPLMKNLHGPGGITYSQGKPHISYSDLYSILSGQFNTSMFKSQKEFNELMQSKNKSEEVIKFLEQFELSEDDLNSEEFYDVSNYGILFQQIFSKERGYPLSYKNTRDGIINFESNYYSKKAYYGLSFDTIISSPQQQYRGWNIVERELEDGTKQYFISQYKLQEETFGKHLNSLKEAKKAIDENISKQTFKSSFFIQLHQNLNKFNTFGKIDVSSKTETLQKGNVIKIPDISLPNNPKILDPRENIISGDSTIEDFKQVIKMWPKDTQKILLDEKGNLIKDVNTVAKAGLFLTLLNVQYENKERTPKVINDILEQIRNAKLKYFYVEEVHPLKIKRINKTTGEVLKDKHGNILYKEIKQLKLANIPNPNAVAEADMQKNGFQYSVIGLWEEVAETLNKTFDTKINILTQSEIEDQFGKKYAKEKAFIIGDNVYINSTLGSTEDLFHEYIHIIMGYLKVNNPEVYSNLLQQVWKYTDRDSKSKILRDYKELNQVAKLEENFARQFAEYIYNRGNSKLNEIFNSDELEGAFETIFDKADFNLKELGTHQLAEIFNRFSSEISMALQKDDKLFGTFASSEEFRLNNKKTNLLQKWIKEGKIKEFNCR